MSRESEDLPYSIRKLGLPYYATEAWDAVESDRPRGIITSDDREFLIKGKMDRSERAVTEKRRRLRSRIRNGIMDFTLFDTCLSEEDREAIFNPHGQALESEEEVMGSVISMLAFLYDGIGRTERDFESVLRTAIDEVERREK